MAASVWKGHITFGLITIPVRLLRAARSEREERRFHSPDRLGGTSVSLHLQVDDAESVWRQAVDAGAFPVIRLARQFWGELYGRLKDPFGHECTIAQMLESFEAAKWKVRPQLYFVLRRNSARWIALTCSQPEPVFRDGGVCWRRKP